MVSHLHFGEKHNLTTFPQQFSDVELFFGEALFPVNLHIGVDNIWVRDGVLYLELRVWKLIFCKLFGSSSLGVI